MAYFALLDAECTRDMSYLALCLADILDNGAGFRRDVQSPVMLKSGLAF